MTAEPPTLTPELLAERAAIAFLEQFAADQVAGQQLPLSAYLQGSPLFHARIATEWLRATGQLTNPVAADSHASAAAANMVGPYRLLGELGRGGQGVVHLAEHSLLHRQVALKLLHGSFHAIDGSSRRRFRREAEAIARLDHTGIATIYDYADDGQQAWIAMRFVAGGSLQQQIDAARSTAGAVSWTAAEAAAIVERAAQALAVAHGQGILHRDIKPGNLLLDANNQPVLVDFGLAADKEQITAPWTAAGSLFGTLNYLPPERLSGHPPDVRGDVFALGVVLFELLTLQRPFSAATTAQELRNAVSVPAPDVRSLRPQVPRDLALIVATAVASDPRDRYQTAAALAEDLRRFRCCEPIAARPAPWHLRTLRLCQRNRGLALSLLATLLVLATGMLVAGMLWQRSESALREMHRLADLQIARQLRLRAEQLWPALPDLAPALAEWLAEHDALATRRPLHASQLAGLPTAATEPVVAWQRQQLEELQQATEHLAELAKDVRRRRLFAETVTERSLATTAEAWQAARERVAAAPIYSGLQLVPQLGLVPLGPDPASGLEEFAHLASGELPQQDQSGQRTRSPDHAIILVLIPGGRALLGAEPSADPGRSVLIDDSADQQMGPCHEVVLAPFFLAKFEMTQAQWRRHTGNNPSTYRPGNTLTPIADESHPVELVSWDEADAVLRQLALQLPTEAQWEWAYRAGSTSAFPCGSDPHCLQGRENLADRTAKELGGNQRWRFLDWLSDGALVHAQVGSYLPNGFGLHDLGGNVKEWCLDSWEDYQACEPRPGDGLRRGRHDRYRVLRGGSFASHSDDARSASRGGAQRDASGAEVGLRAARPLQQ